MVVLRQRCEDCSRRLGRIEQVYHVLGGAGMDIADTCAGDVERRTSTTMTRMLEAKHKSNILDLTAISLNYYIARVFDNLLANV